MVPTSCSAVSFSSTRTNSNSQCTVSYLCSAEAHAFEELNGETKHGHVRRALQPASLFPSSCAAATRAFSGTAQLWPVSGSVKADHDDYADEDDVDNVDGKILAFATLRPATTATRTMTLATKTAKLETTTATLVAMTTVTARVE